MANQGFAIDRPRDSEDSIRDSLDIPASRAQQPYDDKDILDEEEEVEDLLEGPRSRPGRLQRFFGVGTREKQSVQGGRGSRKLSGRMSRRRMGRDEAVELMHDMEDGGKRSSSESSHASSGVDIDVLSKARRYRTSNKSRIARLTGIHIVLGIAVLALLYGAYRASASQRRPTLCVPGTLSNGTTLFAPTTILISLDGFRADFLNRGITPNLNALVRSGVSPKYMLPSFPSVTFPNHFTLVTGLYPSVHGVVGNSFWDPVLEEEFYYTDPERSMHPRFWNAEPLWTLAERQGVRSAIHMWPGSEAHIGDIEPAYVDKFNADEPLNRKVRRILGLLDLPEHEEKQPRPQLIAAYVPNVDADGHKFGPNSTEIRGTITEVDNMIGDILKGLEARNLTDVVNVVVVSDHGMATTSTDRLVQLDDIIDMSQIEHEDGWPLYGLRPKKGVDLQSLHDLLKEEAAQRKDGAFDVYLRDSTMPGRYHFSSNDRIAPLWIVPKAGWAIVTRKDFDVQKAKDEGKAYHPRGLHGYDHEHPLMRAIFIARGPAFPHEGGSRVPVFQNTEVYGLVCDSLGLARGPTNGTLSLPLKPDGKHESIGEGPEEQDLPSHTDATSGSVPRPPSSPERPPTVSNVDDEHEPFNATAPADMPPAGGANATDVMGDDEMERKKTWLTWFKEKVKQVQDWASDIVDGKKKKVPHKDVDEEAVHRPVVKTHGNNSKEEDGSTAKRAS